MQTVEVRIPGQFWDSFIYNDRLYLFTLNGDIQSYRWDKLVESVAISIDADCRPLFWQFLARGQAWYSRELQKLLESPKILNEIKKLTDLITSHPHQVSSKILKETLIETTGSPAHPHTDVEAFHNTLYISSPSGVRAAPLSRRLSNNFKMLVDIPALRMACSYGSMAVAAGSDGMYDQVLTSFEDFPRRPEPRQLSPRNCIACSWSSFDVIGTAGAGDAGFVAAFAKPQKDETESGLSSITTTSRQLLDVIGSDDLFQASDGLLFGADNLLVMTSLSSIYVDGWNPYRRREDRGVDLQKSLFSKYALTVDELTDAAIDGAVAVFGVAIEMDSALLVRGVSGDISGFGEPVNWRTYPRSRRYLNQLHVTYDDYLSIFAFVDDYFISDQARSPAAASRPRPG